LRRDDVDRKPLVLLERFRRTRSVIPMFVVGGVWIGETE